MFSLIITIISIALVAALALATLYFGGDAFNQGSAKAAAATVVNQASQISGANTLYFLDNQAYSADVATLVTDAYLGSAPNPGNVSANAYALSGSQISLDGVSEAVCQAINAQSGATVDLTTPTDLATATASGGQLADVQFGCIGKDTTADTTVDTYEFAFK